MQAVLPRFQRSLRLGHRVLNLHSYILNSGGGKCQSSNLIYATAMR